MAIHSIRIDDLKELLSEDRCEKYFNYGHLVQKMGLPISKPDTFGFYDSGFEHKMLVEKDTIHLMTYFPNIEEITVGYEYYKDYLRVLLNTELKIIKRSRLTNE
ncbi:hypothetical protein BDF21DRAFT_420268 [Thamnidium elegans]|nr:hypothetical protein BDF21DRAFT_420268 [Thamnidium elegans]